MNVTGKGLLKCLGGGALVLLVAAVAVPFSRGLLVGWVTGDPICEDMRPLSYYIRRLDDPNPAVARNAFRQIARLHGRAAPAIPALVELARDPVRGERDLGDGELVRLRAISTIGEMEYAGAPAVPGLTPLLAHPHEATREAVVHTLVRIGPASVTDPAPIVAALDRPDMRMIILGLLEVNGPDVLKGEIRRRLAPEFPPEERRAACNWARDLGQSRGQDLVDALGKAKADPDPTVRAAAEEALITIRRGVPLPGPAKE